MKYYLLKATENGWVTSVVFSDFDHMIYYLARHQRGKLDWRDGYPCYNNEILDHINMNFNDTYIHCEWFKDPVRYTRPYLIMDEDDRIIDPRRYYYEIENYDFPPYQRRYPKHVFRRGPVPGTGHRHHYHFYRSMNYGRIVRMVNHPDFKEYGRKKPYECMEQVWFDYPVRHYDRSWKSSYKCRKQWQKNLK